MRSGLVMGVLDLVSADPSIPTDGPPIRITAAGNTHIKTFAATGASVVGNIEARLSAAEIDGHLAALSKVSKVWGYRIPLKKVDAVPSQGQ